MDAKFGRRFAKLLDLDEKPNSDKHTQQKRPENPHRGQPMDGDITPFGDIRDFMASPPGAQNVETPVELTENAKGRYKHTKTTENTKGREKNTKTTNKTWGPAGQSSFDVGGYSSGVNKKMQDSRAASGLSPVKTMVTAFSRVVNYRTYRLRNRKKELTRRESLEMYDLKQQIDGLNPTMDAFDGRKPIQLLAFLAVLRDTFDTLGTSEAASVRISAYFLTGEAKDVHVEQFGLVEYDFESGTAMKSSDHGSCTHVVHALLRRFPSDVVLRKAHDAVSRAGQRNGEDEAEFAERISKAARLCRHVFRKEELINYYVQGFRTAVREMVSQHVRQMTGE